MFLPQAHKRGHSETFLGDGYVYYVDCGDNLMSEWDIFIFKSNWAVFVHQLY